MSRPDDLERHVLPELDAARLERQWSAILDGRRPRRWHVATGLTLTTMALLLAIGVGVVSRWPVTAPETVAQGTVLESSSDGSSLELSDGSRIDLEAQSRVEVTHNVPNAVRVELDEGAAWFTVAPNAARVFVVVAAGVEVRVIGTRFLVAIESEQSGRRVDVEVERGTVETRTQGTESAITRLDAGQRWSTRVETTAAAAGSPADEHPSVTDSDKPGPFPNLSARQIFDAASRARRRGDVPAAVYSYHALLRHFPYDERAGLAAFELGRLQMDRLGDFEGALESFDHALRVDTRSPFREDAMARVARAQGHAGNSDACREARDAYLARYPKGLHAASVRLACRESPRRSAH